MVQPLSPPSQQKAVSLPRKLGPWTLNSTQPVPSPKFGEVLVRIHSAGLNHIDWKVQKLGMVVGNYPAVMGGDAAGVVEAFGEGVDGLLKGDRVLFQGYFTNERATFQEFGIVPATLLAKIPAHVSFDSAAALPVALCTAAVGLYAPFPKGAGLLPPWASPADPYVAQSILILGGASSVGQCAIQLARLSGFKTIVTTASLRHKDLLLGLGASHVIDRSPDLMSQIKQAAAALSDPPPTVVFDAVSNESTQAQGLAFVPPGRGTLVLVRPCQKGIKERAASSGKKVVMVFGYGEVHRSLGEALFARLSGMLDRGEIKPNRVEVLPGGLNAVEGGLRRLRDEGCSALKLVVRPHET